MDASGTSIVDALKARSAAPRRRAGRTLTDRGVRALQAANARYEVWDASLPGFGVRVAPSGLKAWVVRFQVGAQRRREVVGQSWKGGEPTTSLKAARDAARARLRQAAEGAVIVNANRTLTQLAEEFLADGRSLRKRTPWRPKTRAEFERIVRTVIVPAFSGRRPEEVTKGDVRRLVEGIAASGAGTMANRVLEVLRLVYTWAIRYDRIESAPAWPQAPSPEVKRERVLTEDELRAAWEAMGGEPGILGPAFKLMLLTAQRRGEVLRLRWRDVAHESDGAWWNVPAEFTKNAKPHRVPLPAAAVELLDELRPLSGAGDWVFPSPRAGTEAFIANPQKAAERLWRRAGVKGARVHDLRRTAASYMAAAKVPRLIIGKILNHTEREITATYDRFSYDGEKRHALELWAFRVQEIAAGKSTAAIAPPILR